MQHVRHSFAALPRLFEKGRVLVALDFDGTLCPIAATPDGVEVQPAMLEVVRALATSDCIGLAIISGRELRDVTERLPVDAIFAGNHGLEIRGPHLTFEHPQGHLIRSCVAGICEDLGCALTDYNGAFVENKGLTATVHYRNLDPTQRRSCLKAVRQLLSSRLEHFRMRAGKKALEILPRVGWDKGFAVQFIAGRIHAAACICVGDDRTDEAMFAANVDGLNVRVGGPCHSRAGYYAEGPDEVRLLLQEVLHCGSGGLSSLETPAGAGSSCC